MKRSSPNRERGRNIERIGAIYGVHRATVARWIAQGRDSLLELVERELAKRLAVEVDEVGSIIRLVRSRIEVSLVRLLDEPGAPPSDDASDRRSTSCRLACSFARAGSAAAVLSDPSSCPSKR